MPHAGARWSDGLSPDEILVRAGRIGWCVHAIVVGLCAAGLGMLQLSVIAIGLAGFGIPLSLLIACMIVFRYSQTAYFVLTGLAGIMWGALALAVSRSGDETALLFVTLAIGGTAAAAIAIQFPRPWLAATSLTPALAGLTLAHLVSPPPLGLVIAPMVLIYGLLLGLLARYMSEIFRANRRLAAQLAEQVDALGEAVAERDRAMAIKERLLRHAGHDMRQALHAVTFVLHFLRDQKLTAETRDLVARGQRSLDVLGGLFQSLQDISQIKDERVRVRTETVELGALLHRATAPLAGHARLRNVNLSVHASRARIETDPLLLQRIVQNIGANAVKFACSRVIIGARRRQGVWQIDIVDDGPGIPLKRQGEIFEEFTQLQPGSAETPGLGLGLAIVKELTGKLGLSVQVGSRLGYGTRFTVSGWPVETHPQIAPPDLPACAVLCRTPPDAETRRVLDLARAWGYRVQILASDDAARTTPDSLTADVFLAVDGLETELGQSLLSSRASQLILLNAAADTRTPHNGILRLKTGWRPAQLRSALMSRSTAPADAGGEDPGPSDHPDR
jgi:signal transduction histidine kinase